MMARLVSVPNPLLQRGQDFIHAETLWRSTCDLRRRKREAFFLYLPLVWALEPFKVFFAPLSACTVQGGIWPSAAKPSFTPPQKPVYYLVGNSMHVIPLFPECRTLQMNLNCLARYQYNKLKRSKAHSPTAALERCRPRGAVWGNRTVTTVLGPTDNLF